MSEHPTFRSQQTTEAVRFSAKTSRHLVLQDRSKQGAVQHAAVARTLGILGLVALSACSTQVSSRPTIQQPLQTQPAYAQPAPPAPQSDTASSETMPPETSPAAATTEGLPEILELEAVPTDAPEVVPSILDGKPESLEKAGRTAYWIWQDATGGWHLRTSAVQPAVFRGRITAAGKPLAQVVPTRVELNDRFRITPGRVNFAFRTGKGLDGLDFRVPNDTCVRMRLRVNGAPAEHVLLGRQATPAPSSAIRICANHTAGNPAIVEVRELKTKAVQIPRSALKQRPTALKASADTAYWLWSDGKKGSRTWHLRTTATKKTEFRGRVWGKAGAFSNVAASRLEIKDRFHKRGNAFFFALKTGTKGIDGFDFEVPKGCVHLRLMINNMPGKVLLGKEAKEAPPAGHLRICR